MKRIPDVVGEAFVRCRGEVEESSAEEFFFFVGSVGESSMMEYVRGGPSGRYEVKVVTVSVSVYLRVCACVSVCLSLSLYV